ncbi:hypothetical protein [Rubrivirga litoralis]|uniref:Uncharacterized protein n=1 Tax=Rubrivirga litoralis TaxID=3075598 RepID=A0ABU3BQQ3_9BACT|nr:hypothetical protein [Rubrivirga sp. F394]MDT0631620.1 hypothetical protein [Rubrivirga sp. F394]
MRLPPRPLLLLAALAALPACQDAAGVGVGLIDDADVDPATRTVEAASVEAADDRRPAIGFADSTAALAQTRVLAGDVADPVFGDARAVGYLDVVRPAIPEGMAAADVRSVRLELQRTYVYGDTTAALALALRQVDAGAGSWSPSLDYAADTLFAVGPVLTSTTVSAADETVAFDLPASWVEANAELLLAANFNEAFEGFALEPTRAGGAGAVFGFQAQTPQTRLRVITTNDTLSYRAGEVFSSLQRGEPRPAPDAFVAAQVGSGRSVRLLFPLDAIGPAALARAVLRAPLETTVAEEGSFVRPVAQNATLFGVDTATGTRTPIVIVTVEGGAVSAAQSDRLTQAVQAALLGAAAFDAFELVPGALPGRVQGTLFVPASLDVLPVLRPGGAEAPRLSLTVVGS